MPQSSSPAPAAPPASGGLTLVLRASGDLVAVPRAAVRVEGTLQRPDAPKRWVRPETVKRRRFCPSGIRRIGAAALRLTVLEHLRQGLWKADWDGRSSAGMACQIFWASIGSPVPVSTATIPFRAEGVRPLDWRGA